MTPRQLDWRAVQPKLRKIDELLGRLRQLGEFDEKRLQTDHVDALAVERILTLVVDLAFAVNSHTAAARLGRAPDTYAESFTLAAEIGLITRELGAALAPSAIDYAQVAAAIPLALRDYGEYVRQAAQWMREHAERDN
jgi:uncharacterized protein YutE (UPF0331/DUF86 family)